MKKYKKGIKICRSFKNYFTSFTDLGFVSIYKIGKWTERTPEQGPFAVFDSLINALKFTKYFFDLVFFECEYEQSSDNMLYYIFKYRGNTTRNEFVDILPEGTILADRVKILKEIKIKGKK